MLTPHELMIYTFAPADYVLHEWMCTCGARCIGRRRRSRVQAEIDWWGDHVLPDATPVFHLPTYVPGGFENAVTWTCTCGDVGEPGGFTHRRAMSAFTQHANRARVQWYREEWKRMVSELPYDERRIYTRDREAQRYDWEASHRRAGWALDDVRAALRDLI